MYDLRPLHYVFKVNNRKKAIDFLTHNLGMTVLRHEEFSEGCKATCNGAFDNRWSKSMVGFGSEDTNFVFEIVYNYGVNTAYKHGTDFKQVTVECLETASADAFDYSMATEVGSIGKVAKIALNVSNLAETEKFWEGLLGLPRSSKDSSSPTLNYQLSNIEYEFHEIGDKFERTESAGRTAFSAPTKFLEEIQTKAKPLGFVHTELVSLDTPGKSTVHVVILQDPDGHEVCIVGDEAFRELSVQDPEGPALYKRYSEKYG